MNNSQECLSLVSFSFLKAYTPFLLPNIHYEGTVNKACISWAKYRFTWAYELQKVSDLC